MGYLRMSSLLLVLTAIGCSGSEGPGGALPTAPALSVQSNNPMLHHVTVGGPDACVGVGAKPGCDKNFVVNAMGFADGTASGMYSDLFGGDLGGFHAVVDCLVVDGNEAWIGGTITKGSYPFPGFEDATGQRVITRVKDNGTSANDPPDQVSGSLLVARTGNPNLLCTDMPQLTLRDAPQGQVKVN